MKKVLIIDDENKSRRVLEELLKINVKEIDSILHASDLVSGVEIIKNEKPQIVFLDIEMPQYSGLQILEFFTEQEVDFQIIFTTAYNHYAIEAFKLSAIDYLLKPLDVEELVSAVDKAILISKAFFFSVDKFLIVSEALTAFIPISFINSLTLITVPDHLYASFLLYMNNSIYQQFHYFYVP